MDAYSVDMGEILVATFRKGLRLPQLRRLYVSGTAMFASQAHLDPLTTFIQEHPNIEELILQLPRHLDPDPNQNPEMDILPRLSKLEGPFRHIKHLLTPLANGASRPLLSLNARFLSSEAGVLPDLTAAGPTLRSLDIYTPFHVAPSFLETLTDPCVGLRYLRLDAPTVTPLRSEPEDLVRYIV